MTGNNMRFIWLMILVFLLGSCQSVEEPQKPDDLISEDKMVEVLTDLAILNSAKNFNRRRLEEKGIQPDVYLYEKHDIDSTRLARSMEYYAKDYERFEDIFAQVKNDLEAMQMELEEIRDEEQRVLDSLQEEGEIGDSIIEIREMRTPVLDTLVLPDPPNDLEIE